jgi:hypothetical protein
VDVEHPPLPTQNEIGRKQAHEAGEAHEFDAVLIERGLECLLERGPVRAERLVVEHRRPHAGSFREREARRVRPVRQDEGDLGWIGGRPRCFDQGAHVGAAARDEDGDPFARLCRHGHASS